MSATACTLAAVLVFEAAASPATEECPLTDNRCKAGQYERRAATAPTPAQRALYLYGAYRSYMLLFDTTADRADLCAARRTLDASLSVAGQPPGQRATSRTKRAELVAGVECKSVARRSRVKKTEAPLVARRPDPAPPVVAEPPADLEPPGTKADLAHVDLEPSTTTPPVRTAYLEDHLDGAPPTTIQVEPDADLMPMSARRVNTERPASTSRPGRGLVIAGGVTLGVGVVLTTTAGVTGRHMVDTRQQILALSSSVDGYATADQNTRDDALRGDFRARQTQTLALAIGGGATVLVAVLLSSIGGRRMARAASRTALVPAPGGLVFHARF